MTSLINKNTKKIFTTVQLVAVVFLYSFPGLTVQVNAQTSNNSPIANDDSRSADVNQTIKLR